MSSTHSRNVLLLAYAYPPDSAAGASRPARLVKYLPAFGYTPHVLTAARQTTDDDKNVTYVADDNPRWERELWRLIPEAGIAWMRPALARSLALLREIPFGLVFSTSPPITSHWIAYQIKRRAGLPWVADFRDPIRSVEARRHRPTRMIDPLVERFIFRHADAVIANTDAASNLWARRYPEHAAKTFTIWNGFDPEEKVVPMPISPSGRRVLLHAGELYPNRHPGPLLEAVRQLAERGDSAIGQLKIVIIGVPDAEVAIFARGYEDLQERGMVEFSGRLSRADAKHMMETADSLLLLDCFGEHSLQVPSKLFDYIRIGRPILAITKRASAADRILSQSGVSHSALYWGDSVGENARKLSDFLALPSMPMPASEWFLKTFDGRVHAGALASVFDRLWRQAPSNNVDLGFHAKAAVTLTYKAE